MFCLNYFPFLQSFARRSVFVFCVERGSFFIHVGSDPAESLITALRIFSTSYEIQVVLSS